MRLHALVQHVDDLDNARLNHAIEDHMHGVQHGRLSAFVTGMPDVKATDARNKFAAIHCGMSPGSAAILRIAAVRHVRYLMRASLP